MYLYAHNMRKPKLFVSYSRIDVEYLEKLKVQIKGLKRNGLIEEWSDQQINPGVVWEDALKYELETADIILFLVSSDFIASDYIHDVEISKAIERHNKGEVIIVPVIIRPCDFASLSISKFQALPQNAKPVSRWEDKDEAWLDVLQGIKRIIEGFEKMTSNIKKKNPNGDTATDNSESLKMKIADGDIQKVINGLLKITKDKDNSHYNSVIMQSGKFNRLKKEVQDGLISGEQQRISTSKIESALLAIVDELGLE